MNEEHEYEYDDQPEVYDPSKRVDTIYTPKELPKEQTGVDMRKANEKAKNKRRAKSAMVKKSRRANRKKSQ